jgi:lysophospholipase
MEPSSDRLASKFEFLPVSGGGVLRFGCWAPNRLKPRGSILLLGGRTEFIEKYAETIGELIEREYSVCSFDWRGQGLSSRLLSDPHKGHIDTFDTYLADLDLIVKKVFIPRGQPPHIVLAHSMGGHVALKYLFRHPNAFAKGILTAPMIDVCMTVPMRKCLQLLVNVMVAIGGGCLYTIGSGKNAWRHQPFKGNRLTSDRHRFVRTRTMLGNRPALAIGGATYMWVKAAFDSIADLDKHKDATPLAIPIVMVRAGKDQIVSNRAQQIMCGRLPNCKLITIPGARHEILIEKDPYRSLFWEAFDALMLDV